MLKVAILEYGLDLSNGHFQTTPIAISQVYSEMGCYLLSDRTPPDGNNYPIKSLTIGKTKYDLHKVKRLRPSLRKIWIYLQLILKLKEGSLKSISKTLRKHDFSQQDFLVVPSASEDSFELALRLTNSYPDTPTFVLRFLGEDVPFSFLNDKSRHQALQLIKKQKLILFTETEEHKLAIEKHLGLPVADTLILPTNISPFFPESLVGKETKGATFRVGVLGGPRRDKGSDRIASILSEMRKLRSQYPSFPEIELAVQMPKGEETISPLYEDLVEMVEDEKGVRLIRIGDHLSREEFIAQTHKCHCLLLPYPPEQKKLQGSGLILDGAFAKVPLVYSDGMPMRNFLSHGNARAATSDHEFAQAIFEVAQNYAAYQEGCERAFKFACDKVFNPPSLNPADYAKAPQQIDNRQPEPA